MALKNCKHCGGRISDKADMCPHCGASNPDKSEATEIIAPNLSGEDTVIMHHNAGGPKGPDNDKKKKWLIPIIIACILLVGGGIVWIVLGVHAKHEREAQIEQARLDSIHAVEMELEAIRQDSIRREQARIDSIRQDSIQKVLIRLVVTDLLKREKGYKGFADFKKDAQLEAALKKAAFTLVSKKVKKDDIEVGTVGDTAPGKTRDYVYSKEGVKVEWQSYTYDDAPNDDYKDCIAVTFTDNDARSAFIESLLKNGYKKEDRTYTDPGSMIWIVDKGNVFQLIGNWE